MGDDINNDNYSNIHVGMLFAPIINLIRCTTIQVIFQPCYFCRGVYIDI